MSLLKGVPRRSSEEGANEAYEFGLFRIDVGSRQLLRDAEVIPLTSKAFETLLLLLRHGGHVVEKDELLKVVWPDSFVSEDSLTQNIATLRKALGDSSSHPQYIATVPKRGYQFIEGVRTIGNRTDRPSLAEPVETPPVKARGEEQAQALHEFHEGHAATQFRAPRRLWMGVSALAIVIALVLAFDYARRAQPGALPVRFVVHAPQHTTLTSGGFLSPNGRHLAFVAQDPTGQSLLWVRGIDDVDARSLPETDGATQPFWSPDSESIGFVAQGKIKKVGLLGAPPQTLAVAPLALAGGTWSPEGVMLFGGRRTGVLSVAASGGTVAPITTLDPTAQEIAHRWPHFLPDGRHFLYVVVSANPERGGVYVGSLDSSTRIRLLQSSSSDAVYSRPGYVFFLRDRTLMAQRFDAERLRFSEAPQSVAAPVSSPDMVSGQTFSAAGDNILSYVSAASPGRETWFGRSGEPLASIDAPIELNNPAISPDAQQLAAGGSDSTSGIWLVDLRRGATSRITTDGTVPLWAPDGSRIAFSSHTAAGVLDLYQVSTIGNGQRELLLSTGRSLWAHDWSLDGRFIVYVSISPVTKADLWLFPQFGDRKPSPYLQTPFNEVQPQVSPNGRWMAYTSDESGTWEVYVQSFPVPGSKRMISTHGGAQPRWRGDGRELFYLAADRKLMVVGIEDARTLEMSVPKPLFQTDIRGDLAEHRSHYVVTPDGQRFLVDTGGERANQPITVLLNWAMRLKK